MNIKEIRSITKLSQQKFCEKYHIPKRTLEDWEVQKSKPPIYLLELLEFRVKLDYENLSTLQKEDFTK